MVDLLTRAANLLVFFARVNLCGLCLLIFIVILVFFSCFPPPFLLKQLWAFISLEPPGAFVVLQAFPEFEESTFLLAGATFICITGLEVLFFNNGILFLSQPPSRLLRTCSKHHYGPFWMPVPLVAFADELHGSDDGVLQLARGFLWGRASVMRGGVSMCLVIWT